MCVGLDPTRDRLPMPVRTESDPVFAFNQAIIDATADVAAAFKPNSAFYEALGVRGWESLARTIDYIGGRVPVILDAKRGDIDSTAVAYAEAAFGVLKADACTVNAYLGLDSVAPFLADPEHGAFVLCRTSNGSAPFLQDVAIDGEPLYLRVARAAVSWNAARNVGLVTGATYPEEIARVRAVATNLPLLVPGVGAQGGDIVAAATAAAGGPFVINSSRGIIFASSDNDFAAAARAAAVALRDRIASAA